MNMEMIFIAVLMVGLMAFTIFSQKRQQKKMQEREQQIRSSLAVGVKVHTAGGFIGNVVAIDGDRIVIECGPDKVRLELLSRMVAPLDMLDGEETQKVDEPEENENADILAAPDEADTQKPTAEEEVKEKTDTSSEE